MEVELNKTKVDESRSRFGLRSLPYDARMKTNHNEAKEDKFKRELKIINPNMGLFQMASEQGIATNHNGYREQDLENVKLVLFYHTKLDFLNQTLRPLHLSTAFQEFNYQVTRPFYIHGFH